MGSEMGWGRSSVHNVEYANILLSQGLKMNHTCKQAVVSSPKCDLFEWLGFVGVEMKWRELQFKEEDRYVMIDAHEKGVHLRQTATILIPFKQVLN